MVLKPTVMFQIPLNDVLSFNLWSLAILLAQTECVEDIIDCHVGPLELFKFILYL